MTTAIPDTRDEWQERRSTSQSASTFGGRSQHRSDRTERLARGLGWFSVGLGLAEVIAPHAFARMIGVRDTNATRNTLVAFGLREIASGVGLLARPQQPGWVWARVGGDLMDLAFLSSEFASDDADRNRVAAATAAVLGVTVLDVLTSQRLQGESNGGTARTTSVRQHGIEVTRAITINRQPDEIYRFWRNFENLPRFMDHLESVEVLDDKRSRWKAKAPAGTSVEWTAEITQDIPGEVIAWQSLPDADVSNAGSVHFVPAPGGRGTEVHVELRYSPPGGVIGATIAKLFGEEPGQQVASDLRRFKQVTETGEVVHSDASIHRGPHPARPSADPM